MNLLLNRASPWADLQSYLPRKKVSGSLNGKQRQFPWRGADLEVGSVRADDKIVVRFPMVEKTIQRDLKSEQYTYTVRGFTVVDLQPTPAVTPLFQRAHYRAAQAPMRKVRRFVSEQRIVW